MDKFRKNRKTSPTRAHTTTSSNGAAATAPAATAASSSTSATTKFTIQQKVPTGTASKKGPYSVKRTVDPNEVFIKRRIGEGAKPLFSRDELCSKKSASPKPQRISNSSSSSSHSSSPENRRRTTKEPTKAPATQAGKKKTPEKVPYFLDEKREIDRIKRVYGSRRSRSLSADRRRSQYKSSRNRSRTRSPPPYRRRYHNSYNDRRSSSRERYRPRYHRSQYSRSRSRSRERRRRHSYRHRDGSLDRRSLQPATQFIPVPVPIDYPYMPPAWGPLMPPQPRFPYMMRPPMPAPVPFMPRHFHPPRFFMPNGFQRGNFRPRY